MGGQIFALGRTNYKSNSFLALRCMLYHTQCLLLVSSRQTVQTSHEQSGRAAYGCVFTLAHFAFEHEHRLHRTHSPYLHHDAGKRKIVVSVLATPGENAAHLKRTSHRRTLFAPIRRFAARTRTRYSEHALQNGIQTRFRMILLSVRYFCCFFCCYFGWCRPGRHYSVVVGDIAVSSWATLQCCPGRHCGVVVGDIAPELCTGSCSALTLLFSLPTGILRV